MLFWIIMLCSFSLAFVPYLVNVIVQIFYQDSESQAHLRRQMSDLRSELAQISMVTEFAKYAKIQRKINKVGQEIDKQNQQQLSSRLKARLITNAVLYAFNCMVILYVVWSFGSRIVLQLPAEKLFPLSYFVVRTNEDGQEGISGLCWLAISGTVAKTLTRHLQRRIQQTKSALNRN
ncbi:hypothetical protein CHUAL_005995 [Chamberlinius hualienensis]